MKNLIVRLDFVLLRNETHVELNENVTGVIEKYTPQTLGIVDLYAVYKPAYATEVSALDAIRKSGYTKEILDQDHRRDGIYRGFVDGVKSALHHFDPAKQAAAERIELVLEHYGNISRKNYDQGTAALDDLIRELSANDYPALLSTLTLTDWLTQLTAENAAFKNLMTERYEEVAQRTPVNMKDARTATDKALHAIIYQIEGLALVNGEAQYHDFIAELNAIFKRYKDILAQERGRRKND
ncbi:MAG: DUF6261 family protein [Dysgonamonadaceae bacterium]|jgi:hypothetical protein|nr:DUF6261 family protein [Dysgonamonadaceae bacterium]